MTQLPVKLLTREERDTVMQYLDLVLSDSMLTPTSQHYLNNAMTILRGRNEH